MNLAVLMESASSVPPETVDALAWTLMHFVWQGAVLGFAAFFALRIVRPERAATRYAIGVATLGVMLATTIITFAFMSRQALPALSSTATTIVLPSVPVAATTHEGVNEVVDTRDAVATSQTSPMTTMVWRRAQIGPLASSVVVTLWALGVLALSLRLLGGWMLTRQLTRHAVAAVSPAINAATKQIADRLQLRRAVAVLESGAVVVPTLIGYVKPVVLLPAVALSGLTPEQLQAILAHELAHVRRHDYLINLLQSIVETLLFYHPAMWWVSAQVRAEREHCCDDLAVEACGDRLVYVSALAELTSIANHRAFALAATDGSLLGRVQRILGRSRASHEPAPAWALLALFIFVAGSIASEGRNFSSADSRSSFANSGTKGPALPVTPPGSDPDRQAIASAEGRNFSSTDSRSSFANSGTRGPALPATPPPAPPAPPAAPAPAPSIAPDAPQAPRAPSAPTPPQAPEAPHPPEPPQVPEIGSRGGSGNMSWSNGTEKISVKWDGAFRLSTDEKDIAWMEDGATLSISDGLVFAWRAELRGVDGRIERTFRKNGFRAEWEPEGRQFLAKAIDRLIRQSGVFAKERVARFLAQGGPDAVLAEIDRLHSSSYVRRAYYTELAKQATLSDALLTKILQRVPNEITSDYDKRVLYTQIVKLPAAAESHRMQIARAARSISSDYDQRTTLDAVMEVQPLPAAVAAAVLEAAGSINSNYDRSMVLTKVAQRGGLTDATSVAFMSLVRSMSSSHDQRRVLTAVTAAGTLPAGVAADAIRSTSTISSSHDRSETLIRMIDSGGLTDASLDAFFQSVGDISSSHDQQRVLRRVLDRPSITPRIVEAVLKTAPRISSGHDRANLLEAVAKTAKVEGAARELYIAAARGLSSHDENRALAALVRSEARR